MNLPWFYFNVTKDRPNPSSPQHLLGFRSRNGRQAQAQESRPHQAGFGSPHGSTTYSTRLNRLVLTMPSYFCAGTANARSAVTDRSQRDSQPLAPSPPASLMKIRCSNPRTRSGCPALDCLPRPEEVPRYKLPNYQPNPFCFSLCHHEEKSKSFGRISSQLNSN